ncbi:MAG: hypothetical protein HUU27_09185, partial [Phycisphaerae bacterium]|nr:hypothetical protein [Phycisphaerae bacterium]
MATGEGAIKRHAPQTRVPSKLPRGVQTELKRQIHRPARPAAGRSAAMGRRRMRR